MIHNGYFVHPEIWQLWAVIILTPINTLLIAALICCIATKEHEQR